MEQSRNFNLLLRLIGQSVVVLERLRILNLPRSHLISSKNVLLNDSLSSDEQRIDHVVANYADSGKVGGPRPVVSDEFRGLLII